MKEKQQSHSAKATANLSRIPVAIIGISAIFPGAHNVNEYWENIIKKIDSITDVPEDRWKIEDYYDPDPNAPDKVYSKRGGFIPDVDFDPLEFGLPPNILEVTDIAQLLALVAARDALADAGYGEGVEFDRDQTGVIVGVVGMGMKLINPLISRMQYPVWRKVLRHSGVPENDIDIIIEKIKSAYIQWDTNTFPGMIANVVAGRIANRFNLGGINCVVDAACASSLAAIKMSVSELIEGRANMMITGGVDTDNSIGPYMCFSKTPAFTGGDTVRPFDEKSDGMMVGEGLGLVVLKRLADAERDGDRIYAVIRGVGSSSDGRFKSIYAPRSSGQAKAIQRTYQEAGFAPETVGLIDAHGTGTMAGDPAEVEGLKLVFGVENLRTNSIALGSVKSQIGHTKATAGAASLIKIALSLHHKVLPATINVTKPNPIFDLEHSPFYLNTETRPWFRLDPQTPRRAAVSSFGFGGTNFHVVLEEYQGDHQDAYRIHDLYQTIILNAPTRMDLINLCKNVISELESTHAKQSYNHLVTESSSKTIPQSDTRIGFVASGLVDAIQSLKTSLNLLQEKADESWEHPRGIFYREHGLDSDDKVVALFPGQGSQYLEMGKELAINYPEFRQAFSRMDKIFIEDGRPNLTGIVYPPPVFNDSAVQAQEKSLTATENAQPAIGAFCFGLFKQLSQAGFKPDFVAGHSFGELTALWASGAIDDDSFLRLAYHRGKAMAAPAVDGHDSGAMLAVKGDLEKITDSLNDLPGVGVANWNTRNQVVLAGPTRDIEQAKKYLEQRGFSTVMLPVSAAFHTAMVEHALEPFSVSVKEEIFNKPNLTVFSNSTGELYPQEPAVIQTMLADHVLKPVLFMQEIENIYKHGGRIFVEIGPKSVLTNLVNSILADKPHLSIALNLNGKKDSDLLFRQAVLQLRVAGLELADMDPWKDDRNQPEERKLSGVSVKLNGGFYISEKTRQAFENALQDDFKISVLKDNMRPENQTVISKTGDGGEGRGSLEMAGPVAIVPLQPQEQITQPQSENIASWGSRQIPDGTPSDLSEIFNHFQEHQRQTGQVHSQYLQNEAEFIKIFSQLMQTKLTILSDREFTRQAPDQISQVLQSVDNSLKHFENHQVETLRIHDQYLQEQAQISRQFVELARGESKLREIPITGMPPLRGEEQSRPAVSAKAIESPPVLESKQEVLSSLKEPAAVEQDSWHESTISNQVTKSAAGINLEEVSAAFLEIVSEKTGYPLETLDPEMDLEADLGIDSIKRVEIMGALQERFPQMAQPDTQILAGLRTIQEIILYMSDSSADDLPATIQIPENSQGQNVQPLSLPEAGSVKVDPQQLSAAFLEVVSEKTGYPLETLDPDMDLEADLGIDSIKRVEILGSIQERYPEIIQPDMSVLSEQRTLQQIIDLMGSDGQNGVISKTEPFSQEKQTQTVVPPTETAESKGMDEGLPLEEISRVFFETVSEKTGYPIETLEGEMDLEADLGIDSIKRVEILGAIQTRFPQLPQPDTERLGMMRTMQEFIDYLSQPVEKAEAAGPGPAIADATGSSANDLVRTVNLQPLSQPDVLDFNLPPGGVCLLTDDGSGVTVMLADKLIREGMKVTILDLLGKSHAGDPPIANGVERLQMDSLDEEQIQKKLAVLRDNGESTAVFIHVDAPYKKLDAEGGYYSQTRENILKQVFLLAKHLQPQLLLASKNGRAAFLTITRMDGRLGTKANIEFDPITGGYSGLVKTLGFEWPDVFCRSVDVSPLLDDERVAEIIWAELHDPNRLLREVGYDQEGRYTLNLANANTEGVS